MGGNIGNLLVVMNLLLRPLNDVNDVTWSIVISLAILLVGVIYCIYTIMKLAFEELENGSDDTPEQEELLQLPSSGDQQSS
jgi:hypothetical protein